MELLSDMIVYIYFSDSEVKKSSVSSGESNLFSKSWKKLFWKMFHKNQQKKFLFKLKN